MFVDPILKERLLREASRGIFVHMIGFDHEPQLKERIKSIAFETRLYQKDYRLTCAIESLGSDVKITMSKELEIFNQGLDKRQFRPGWRFTESDRPENGEIESTIGDEDIKTVPVLFVDNRSGYRAAYGAPVEVDPQHENKRYQFLVRCTTTQPQDWYHPIYFEYPTIGIKFTITAPDGWHVWVGGQQRQQKEAKFHTRKLYMPGEKIEIHWRKPPG